MRLQISSKNRIETKYILHKWKNQLLITDILLLVLVIILLGIFRSDIILISIYVLLYPYLLFTSRKLACYPLLVASIVSIIWMLVAHNQYGYNRDMITIFGLNVFPLFAWASGLFAAYLIYSHLEHKLKFSSPIKKMLLFVAFYWPILITLETVVYHVFNIRNLSTAVYAGLPFCDCIHAPLWMQISYLALGPVYFGICELLGLENPHYTKIA
jgi:hypothetical protein